MVLDVSRTTISKKPRNVSEEFIRHANNLCDSET